MDKKKVKGLIMTGLIIVLCALIVLVIVKCSSNNTEDEMVTITFDAQGGSEVDPIEIEKGNKLENLPQTFLLGTSFCGWYTDKDTTELFDINEAINNDLTLYAGFKETVEDIEISKETTAFDENCNPYKELTFVTNKKLTKDEFLNSIELEAVTGSLPETFDVTISGNNYTLKPVDGYEEGKLYKVTLPDWISFKDEAESVKEYSFRIAKEEVEIVELGEGVKYVLTSELLTFNDDDNYYFSVNKKVYDEYKIVNDDILCIGEIKEYDPKNSLFVKVVDVMNVSDIYYITAIDAQIEEVFSNIDVCFTEGIPSSDIIDSLDTEEIEKEIRGSSAFSNVTNLMAGLVASSDTVKEKLGSTTNSYTDFTNNTYIIDGTLKKLLAAEFLSKAKISIGIGEGHNPNFDKAYTDEFVALNITFEFNATIKKKLEIKAKLEFTQYLAVSVQGMLNYKIDWFEVKWLEFDCATNLYSQTEIDISVLFRALNSEDASYKDITAEITDKLSKDDDNANNLVAELQEMLDSKDGDIDLFRAEILHVPFDIIPGFPILTINIELDFVVKMNFACGFSSSITVLEAVQVGVEGDTRENYIGSYKHDLNGGNRYAINLTACGYLGIKAGFEGGISISFCGLSALGKVGVYVFVGPYIDIYGYCQAEIVKYTVKGVSRLSSNLIGGYYIEIGMNLEVTLEARSKIFKVKTGITLLDKKWPLAKFGNKDVLVSIAGMEDETIYMGSDTYSATLDVNNLPALKGNYLDITTGEMSVKDIPWGKVYLTFSDKSFSYDINTGTITYKNLSSRNPDSVESVVNCVYVGPSLQFNLSSSETNESYSFGTTRIVYYNTNVLNENSAGKQCDVKIYTCLDGEKTLVDELKILAGTRVFDYGMPVDSYYYYNIHWNNVPSQTIVTEDTEFICYGTKKQVYSAYIYYNEESDTWITEIKLSYIDEDATPPVLPEGNKATFVNWDLVMYSLTTFVESTDKDMTETIWKCESTSDGIYDDLYENECEEGVSWYEAATRIYIAQYEYADCELKLISKNIDGEVTIETKTVPFNGNLRSVTIFSPLKMKFKGFALEEDGEVVYENFYEITNVRDDMTLYLVYEPVYYDVTLTYYDGINSEYVPYKTYKIAGGQDISKIDLSEINNKLIVEDGVEYTLLSYRYKREGDDNFYVIDAGEQCYRNIEIYPIYKRKVHITFDILDGMTPVDLSNIYAESSDGYKVSLTNFCIKEADEKYTYKLVGWKNMTTEEIVDSTAVVYCDKPTTFQAVYEATPIQYTLEVSTEHGVLLNGEKEFTFTGDYEKYQEYLSQYQNYTPSERDEDNHTTYIYKGSTVYTEGNKYIIKYNMWDKLIDKYTITIDANGGTFDPQVETKITADWNSKIDLSTITLVKSDDYGTYKIVLWTDSDNQTYNANAVYTVIKDTTLTPKWEIDVKKEYTVKFYLDDKLIKTDVYNKGDKIENLTKPAEAYGLAFSGWAWFDENNQSITTYDIMPSFDIILKGTTKAVYVIYYVDGEEINKTKGIVDSNIKVQDNYTKQGYTVSPWVTSDVTCENGVFKMPNNDVVFTCTTTINSYKVTYYHNNQVYKEELYNYGTYVSLINVPKEQDIYYAWSSEDIKLQATGFIMPDKDIVIESVSSTEKKYIIYYINDEIITYDTAIPKEIVNLYDITNDNKYAGKTFSGWYIDCKKVTEQYIQVEQDNIFVYGYITEGAVKVNIFVEETPLVLYANVGDKLAPEMITSNNTFAGFEIDDLVTSEINITSSKELNVYICNDNAKYELSYNISGLIDDDSLYTVKYIKANDKVYLPALPKAFYEEYGMIVDGWYSFDGIQIEEDENGLYFIMPENNVTLNAVVIYSSKEGYEASLYVVLPSIEDPIFYRTYYVNSNEAPTYFTSPVINNYEFICFKDQEGNIVDGIILDDMDNTNKTFYAYYRQIEMHIIEFVLDGKTVGYKTFYDKNYVELENIDIPSDKGFSGWMSLYLKLFTMNDKIFFMNDNGLDSYIGIDFVFYGYTYDIEAEQMLQINITDDNLSYGNCSLYVNYEDTIELVKKYFDKDITYEAKIIIYNENESESNSIDITNLIANSEGTLTFTYPTLETINSYIPDGYNLSYIEINMIVK